MNKIKVQEFCQAYSKALNLDDEIESILTELMINIISNYEKRIPSIQASLDQSTSSYLIKPINGKYSIEDFFLNRLIRNIWTVEVITQKDIDEGFADSGTKGMFDPTMQEVKLNLAKQESQLKRFEKLYATYDDYERERQVAKRKVITHEFEHGLQTRYDNELNINLRATYKRISDEIMKLSKYRSIIQSYEEIPKNIKGFGNSYLSTGCHISSRLEGTGKRTYRDVHGFDNLNEILNESESLIMHRQRIPIINTYKSSGNSMQIYNPESSNSTITNYGFMFKAVFGDNLSFELMYIDPQKAFERFNNQYNDIFQTIYGSNKDAIELFIMAITEIKERPLEAENNHLKLQLALAKCLEKKINTFYNNNEVSNEQMLESIARFKPFCMRDKNMQLEHIKLLKELEERINTRGTVDIQQSNRRK